MARYTSLIWLALHPVLFLSAGDWPQASGPDGNFIVEGKAPIRFSVSRDENVLWRVPLPSTGQATPIVSGGRVFVTSHNSITQDTETGSTILGMCFDVEDGKELWRRSLPASRVTDLSSLFSDNTAASPVSDGNRILFVNVGGSLHCYQFDGELSWKYEWVPFGRHHARLHEPIVHDGHFITMQYPGRDLKQVHTTKAGAKPLGRGEKYWTRLQAFNAETGKRAWIAEAGTSVHQTSKLMRLPSGQSVLVTGRGGGHQPPEEPYGLSLVDAANGKTIWTTALKGYPSAQNSSADASRVFAFLPDVHVSLDMRNGAVLESTSLVKGVSVTRWDGRRYVRESNVDLPPQRRAMTKNTNLLVGDYHYFRTDSGFLIGRVHVTTGKVEYLQVPVQVVRETRESEQVLWEKAIPNDMRNSEGFIATQDRRNAGNGWGHVSAASPIVVGESIFMPTMIGMVYVLSWNAETLDENALLSISDLGKAGETWTLSSLAYADGKLFARTLKELVCIQEK